ncbi:PepSY domain-containing protein [Leifsonia sp. NPDC058292]|uniref:PepSY domain-containing protein n=1 Tax=Leifsonia sp. NPDC058292 TaxID=3346428 RepID=UPI0036DF04C5
MNRNQRTLVASLGAVPLTIGLLTSCATTTPSTPSPAATSSSSSTPSASGTAPAAPGGTAITDAVAAATAAVPGDVVEISDDTDRNVPVWEVLIRTTAGEGVEVTLDRASLKVLSQEPNDLPDEARGAAPAVSAKSAIASVLQNQPGATVESAELDDVNGRVVWEIDARSSTGTQSRISVDAATGEIVTG